MSKKGRAPRPALSSEHFRSAQSVATSAATTGASSFLTPFLQSPQYFSPPPRQETDGYFNPRSNNNDGKRHRKEKDSKLNSRMEEDENPMLEQRYPALQPQPTTTRGSDSDVCTTQDSTSDAPLSKGDKHLALRTNTQDAAKIVHFDAARALSKPPRTFSSSSTDAVGSPAANALRRLSQHQPANGDSDLPKLRRVSTALSNTFNLFKPRSSTIDPVSLGDSASPRDRSHSCKRSSHGRSLAYRDGDRCRPNPQDNKHQSILPTPSTITLRKASNARIPNLPRSSMSASLSREDEGMRALDAPSSELLAFYSTNRETLGSLSPDYSAPPHHTSLTPETALDIEPELCNKGLVQNPPSIKRHSLAAATTITFADVHIAPGTFAVDSKSRKSSLAGTDQPPRRISVVQFRSRNSIHEVVWREDETTSGSSIASSSRNSNSPPHNGQLLGYGTPAVAHPVGNGPRMPIHERLQGGLLQWSWENPAASSVGGGLENERKNRRPDLNRMASASNPDLTRPRRFSFDLNLQRRSISEAQDILSFPPLRDRSSTLEWRKAPLVDLNEPLSEPLNCRTRLCSLQEGTCSICRGPGVSSDGKMTGHQVEGNEGTGTLHESLGIRRTYSHPYAPARIGPSGRIGSRLGVSSHARVSRFHRF